MTKIPQSIIKSRHLNVFYGEKQALFDIHLDIHEKEIIALIGPSGCGKTSFIRCLNRINDEIHNCRIQGEITLDDQNIYDDHLDVVALRRRVGMVFQKPNPFPQSIFNNVAYGPRIHKMANNKEELSFIIEKSLKRAALWDEVKDRLHESSLWLSGGQQQRLCIARALAVQPDVILMDEPCSALDPIATAHIEELLNELKRDYTIVIVTHSMQQAARVSKRTAFFHMGKMVECGETNKIFTQPKKSQTRDYITGRFG